MSLSPSSVSQFLERPANLPAFSLGVVNFADQANNQSINYATDVKNIAEIARQLLGSPCSYVSFPQHVPFTQRLKSFNIEATNEGERGKAKTERTWVVHSFRFPTFQVDLEKEKKVSFALTSRRFLPRWHNSSPYFSPFFVILESGSRTAQMAANSTGIYLFFSPDDRPPRSRVDNDDSRFILENNRSPLIPKILSSRQFSGSILRNRRRGGLCTPTYLWT